MSVSSFSLSPQKRRGSRAASTTNQKKTSYPMQTIIEEEIPKDSELGNKIKKFVFELELPEDDNGSSDEAFAKHSAASSKQSASLRRRIERHRVRLKARQPAKCYVVQIPALEGGAESDLQQDDCVLDFSECSSLSETAEEGTNSFVDSMLSSFGSSFAEDELMEQGLFDDAFDSYVVEILTFDFLHFTLKLCNDEDGLQHFVIRDIDPKSSLSTLLSTGDGLKAINGIVLHGKSGEELTQLVSHLQQTEDKALLTIEPQRFEPEANAPGSAEGSTIVDMPGTPQLRGKHTRDVFLMEEGTVVLEWPQEGLPVVTTKILSKYSSWQRDAEGDLLLSVNGETVDGMTNSQVRHW
jgi:hypothetical protein